MKRLISHREKQQPQHKCDFAKKGRIHYIHTYMGVENIMNHERVADHYFGSSSGTSSYYSVQAGTYVPTVYSTSYGGWVYFFQVPYDGRTLYTVSLTAGYRYTIRLFYGSSGYQFYTNNDGSF